MTDDNNYDEQFVDNIDTRYFLLAKDTNAILAELDMTEEEKVLTKSIILGLEEEVAKNIKDNKIVSIPNIGICKKKLEPIELRKRNAELREARQKLSKEDYKEFARNIYKDVRNKTKAIEYKNKLLNKYKSIHKKKYDKYAITRGLTYANLYIKALLWFKVIDFDRAVQDQYDRINGRYIE